MMRMRIRAKSILVERLSTEALEQHYQTQLPRIASYSGFGFYNTEQAKSSSELSERSPD